MSLKNHDFATCTALSNCLTDSLGSDHDKCLKNRIILWKQSLYYDLFPCFEW